MSDDGGIGIEPAKEITAWDEIRQDLVSSARGFIRSFRSHDLGRGQVALLAFELTEWGGLIALFVYAFQAGGTRMVGLVALLQQLPAAAVAALGSTLGATGTTADGCSSSCTPRSRPRPSRQVWR